LCLSVLSRVSVPASYFFDRFCLTAQTQRAWPYLSHSFTHFRLHIQPVQGLLARRRTASPGQVWLPPAGALDAALPTPVRKLVALLENA